MSASPAPQSWFRLQFNLGTLLWLMLVVGLGLTWWNDRRQLDQRLQKLEQMYSVQSQTLWGANEVLGKPDDPTGIAGKSWCPVNTQSTDWVEVGYDRPVAAATIDLYETYSVGNVVEVLVVDSSGNETSVWQGTDPTPTTSRAGLFRVPVPKSIPSVQRVKIRVDSTNNNSWACFDAVGLTTAKGSTSWATQSSCSSVYGNGALTATAKKTKWLGLW